MTPSTSRTNKTTVCTDDAQKNHLWQEGRLAFLHLKKIQQINKYNKQIQNTNT